MNTIKSITALLLVTSSLTACKAGGARDGDFVSSPPINDMEIQVMEEKTGVADDAETQLAHGAYMNRSEADNVDGTVTIAGSYETRAARIAYQFDTDPSTSGFESGTSYNPHTDDAGDEASERQIGTQAALENRVYPNAQPGQAPSYNQAFIAYVPKDQTTDMYAGAIVDHSPSESVHGIFGRKTSTPEMSAQSGGAQYSGRAMVSVNSVNYNQGVGQEGLYEGDVTASVDFDTNSISNITGMNLTTHVPTDPGASGGDGTIDLTGSGSFNASGQITGAITVNVNPGFTPDGSGNVVTNLDGSFFGPSAETMGGTFAGTAGSPTAQQSNAQVAGHMILNR
jgi:hypothetical protein